MTTTSSISTGNAQDVSSLSTANSATGSTTLTLSDAVTAKIQPYLDQADLIATQITTNTSKVSSYQQMQTLLTSLRSASANLTTEALEGTNVFNKRVATLTSTSVVSGSSPSDASAILSSTVADKTAKGTHSVIVTQIAQAEIDVSGSVSSTAQMSSIISGFSGGSFDIGESGKSQATISVSSTDTLSDVANAINKVSSTTGVSASIIAVSGTQSVLVLSGADESQTIQMTDTSGILAGLGVKKSADVSNASTSSTTALGLAGSFQLEAGGPTITVSASQTLTDIRDAINNAPGGTVTATIDSFNRLVLTGATTYTDVSGSVLSSLGFGTTANQVQQAQGAILTVDGIAGITRTTNTISDVISGVTLNLKGADSATKITLTIGSDTSSVGTAISNYVTAYNNWQSFVTANDATNSDGTASSTAVLFGDSSLRSISSELNLQVATMAAGLSNSSSTNVNLAAIGISLNSSNQLVIDSATLQSQLLSNFDGVASLFQNTISATVDSSAPTGSALNVSGTNYSSVSGTFTVKYLTATGLLQILDQNNQDVTSNFDISGGYITGANNTSYSGITITFSAPTSGSDYTLGTFSVGNGLANESYVTTKNYGDTVSGSLQTLITNLQDEDLTLQSQYNTLMTEAQNYADFLTQQYAAMSSKIAVANQTLVTLKALMNAQYNSSN